MGEVININTKLYQATIRCCHCDHRWVGEFRYPESVFQCPKCGDVSGRIATDLKKVNG